MFREFNVKFEDVEMIGGTDNLLENTEITKVIVRGDSKMSSLDSTFKNCKELDIIDGELDLNDVSDIDNLLEGTELVKSINLKNINNENISANNSFPSIEEINIGGELYNKKAIQNVIASKEWTFDNFNYTDTVGDNVITKEANVIEDNQITIQDTLEQKAKEIEIKGQTYQNLIEGKGEYNLTDTYSATWNESNNSFENMPNMIEIPEIYGNTVQDESDLSIIQSVGDLYVDEEGNPILDKEGNEQYKLEIETYNENLNIIDEEVVVDYGKYVAVTLDNSKFEEGVKYEVVFKIISNTLEYGVADFSPNHVCPLSGGYILMGGAGFIGEVRGIKTGTNVVNRKNNYTFRFDSYRSTYGQARIRIAVYKSDTLTNKPYIPSQTDKTTILMPYKLCRMAKGADNVNLEVDYATDKIYFDYNTKKYYLEKNIAYYNTGAVEYAGNWGDISGTLKLPAGKWMTFTSGTYKGVTYCPIWVQGCLKSGWQPRCPYPNSMAIGVYSSGATRFATYPGETWDNERVSNYLSNRMLYYIMKEPEIIELDLLEDVELETYSPKTYISTNSEVQPSQMNIINKKALINLKELNTNTGYTIQFKCNEKSDNPIKFNLCGTEKEVDMPIGVNHVSITTSNNLTNNQLELSGYGNTISEVMVVKGEMNQYPEYFDGVQSVGEIQDDGSYKIDIETYSQTNNIFNPNQSYVDGKFINDNGVEQVNTGYGYTIDFIESKPNTRYVGKNTSCIYCYDANKQFISRIPFWGTGTIVSSATPSNCQYVRFQLEWSKLPNKDLKLHKVAEGNSVIDIDDWKSFNISIVASNNPLGVDDKIYWNKSNNRYEIDRNGEIEVPTVTGDVIDLPRLYQRENTILVIGTDNIKPSEIKIEYKDLN